jgi:mersacidin/lichenicidin family type 2 lantibiotic
MLDLQTIIRAWKDKTFRESLSEPDRQALPDHPSGWIELSGEQMLDVTGGGTDTVCSPHTLGNMCGIGPHTMPYNGCGGGGSGTQSGCHISRPA